MMYIAGGVPAERVVSIPNGVDLDVFRPAERPRDDSADLRFLFVGGLIWRKGAELLLHAWQRAFAGRSDVTLVVKDFGATSVYRNADRGPIREYAAAGTLPRLELIDAIDADGDGRGELLFRETTDAATGWVIYRATADKLYKLFDSVNPE